MSNNLKPGDLVVWSDGGKHHDTSIGLVIIPADKDDAAEVFWIFSNGTGTSFLKNHIKRLIPL